MSEMQDEFQADLERAFRKAAKHRDLIARIKKHADEDPERLAIKIVNVVPDRLRETRINVLNSFGVDLADAETMRNYKASSVTEWQIISWLASRHLVYSAFLHLVMQYYRDQNLTSVCSAQAVCDAFIEASEWRLLAVALDFDELSKKLPKQSFPKEELAKVLSGIVTTRTGLSGGRRDRKGLRERLAESGEKPHKQLQRELPAEVLGVFHELRNESSEDLTLEKLSNEVVRRIRRVGASKDNVAEERQDSRDHLEQATEDQGEREEGSQGRPPYLKDYFETMSRLGEDPDLEAAFAAEFLQQVKEESGVTEQQWQSLEASIRLGSNKEAAEELGRSAEQVGKEKFEALKKLRCPAGL
jgi:hypothetical protein